MNSIRFDIALSAEKDTDAVIIPSDVYRSIMSSRFSDVMWFFDRMMWKSFDRRLAVFLLNEANIEGTNTLKMTHEEIGNHLGNPRGLLLVCSSISSARAQSNCPAGQLRF